MTTHRVLTAKEELCRQGEPGDALFVLVEGKVRVALRTPTGAEITIAHREAVSVIGEMSVIDGQPRSATVVAEKTSRVLVLRRADFQQILQDCSDVAVAMLEVTSKKLREATERLAVLTHMTVRSRLAKWLVDSAIRDGEVSGFELALPAISLESLGAQIGAKRDTVGRTLAFFRNKGLLRQDQGRISVIDVKGLREQAEFGIDEQLD